MLKVSLLLVLSVFFIDNSVSQVNLEWVDTYETDKKDPQTLKLDDASNIYQFGTFVGTIDIDPSLSTHNLTSNGERDIFISKSDSNGDLIWAKSFGGVEWDYANSFDIDADGNIYITGGFLGTIDFNQPNPGGELTSNGESDIYILKLDNNGNFLWAKNIGGTMSDWGMQIKVGIDNDIIICGAFRDNVDFDPGPGNKPMILEPDILGNQHGVRLFTLNLSATGDFNWCNSYGNDFGGGHDEVLSLDISKTGEICITGKVRSSNIPQLGLIDFPDLDPGHSVYEIPTSTSVGAITFLLKLDQQGLFIYAQDLTINSAFSNTRLATVISDSLNNVYVAGNFEGSIFLESQGSMPAESNGGTDCFLEKRDSLGNVLWAHTFGGSGYDFINGIDLDDSLNIYLTGNFHQSVDFDMDSGTNVIDSEGNSDIYFEKISNDGELIWVKTLGSYGPDYSASIAVHNTDFYVSGDFTTTVDFSTLNDGSSSITANGSDNFLAKYSTTSALSLSKFNEYKLNAEIYPNPNEGTFVLTGLEVGTSYQIYDAAGKLVMSKRVTSTQEEVVLPIVESGNYFLSSTKDGKQGTIQFLVKKK